MPIRDENKARYPKDWKAISLRIRERAGQKCEKCQAPNGGLISRGKAKDGTHVWRNWDFSAVENSRSAEDGSEVPNTCEDLMDFGAVVRVVLTVAHLDHQPENCADDNLKAWCQRCHNIYDMPMRKAGIASRARQQYAAADLFAPPSTPQETP